MMLRRARALSSRLRPMYRSALAVVAALTVFLVAYAYVYDQTEKSLRVSAINEAQGMLDARALEIAERFRTEYAAIGNLRAVCPEAVDLARDTSGITQNSDFARLLLLRSRLSVIFKPGGCFCELALLYMADTPFMCASSFTFQDLRAAIQSGQFSAGGMNADALFALVSEYANNSYTRKLVPATAISIGSASANLNGDMLLYIRRLLPVSGQMPVYAILFLDAGELAKLLTEYPLVSGVSDMTDASGAQIFPATGAEAALTGYDVARGVTTLTVPIGNIGLTARVTLCDEDIFARIRPFLTLLKTLFFAFAVMASIFLAMLVVSFVLPIARLVRRVRSGDAAEEAPSGGMLAPISQALDTYTDKSRRLEGRIMNIEPVLRVSLIGKLLTQDALTPAERELLLSIPKLSGMGAYRVVAVGEVAELPGKLDWRRTLASALPEGLFYPVDAGKIAVLLAYGDFEQARQCGPEAALSALMDSLPAPRSLAAGVGLLYDSIEGARASYKDAAALLSEACMWKNTGVYTADQGGAEAFSYQFPYAELERMRADLLSGDAEAACGLLDDVARRNFGEGNPNRQSRDICGQFYIDILGALVRVAAQAHLLPLVSGLPAYESCASFDAQLCQWKDSFRFLSEVVSQGRRDADKGLSGELQKYIIAHYAEPSLSQTQVADAFSMSESSLSRYFKTRIGVNFSVYLERLRLSEAEVLLLRRGASVKETAARVGYASAHTFQTAFKRKYGVTPSEWMQSHGSVGK